MDSKLIEDAEKNALNMKRSGQQFIRKCLNSNWKWSDPGSKL